MSRREEVEAEMKDALRGCDDGMEYSEKLEDKCRTLADEIDALRMTQGCTRGQRTTQYCAEAADRDRVIGELLALLKPDYPMLECSASLNDLYARACEIAGRTE